MKKKNVLGTFLMLLLSLLGFAASLPFLMQSVYYLAVNGVDTDAIIMVFYIAMAVQYFASLIIHEGGHCLAGLASGYRFVSFRVGTLMIQKTGKGTELKKLRVAGTGGQCLMSPPDMADGKIPVIFYNLGGALANLAATLLSVIFFFLFRSPYLKLFLTAGIGANLMAALTNGVPLRTRLINNDGMNALELSRDPAAMRAFWIQLKVSECVANGYRVSQLPMEWFAMPTEDQMRNSVCASLAYLRVYRFLDSHDFESTCRLANYLLASENSITPLQKYVIECNRTVSSLLLGDHSFALHMESDRTLSRLLKTRRGSPDVMMTQYVYQLLHNQDEEKAEKVRQRFENTAASYPYPGDVSNAREIIDIANRRFLAGKAQQFTPDDPSYYYTSP